MILRSTSKSMLRTAPSTPSIHPPSIISTALQPALRRLRSYRVGEGNRRFVGMTNRMKTSSSNIRGAIALLLAMLIFSLQDIAVKWIGGDYPVLEIVVFRSLVALPCVFIFLRYEGK